MKLAIVAACAVLSGCALQPRASEWTDQERIAFGASLAGHAVDLGSSLASDERYVERHVFLGDHPSNGALIGIKAMAIAAEYPCPARFILASAFPICKTIATNETHAVHDQHRG